MSDVIGSDRPSQPGVLSSVAPAARASWVELTAQGERSYRVRLGGFFGPAWMANLCQGIAQHRISIERAHAMRSRDGSWLCELHVLALDGAADATQLPYVALAEATAVHGPGPLTLDRYELVQTPDHGGALKLTIEAADALGLLGALLALFAELWLFPLELHIDTREGRAHDVFWLGAMRSETPSIPVLHALDRRLARELCSAGQ